ncbi:TcpQ domain-containing protein [Burkholderia vietnamiensis]|uniref:TcpQ domain-containing protein n=1 Tax=Burkholderia vietnamiensis TaxID=60552 RepID=UPI001CF589BB|nr:TcpQ domain-containing protein [Burkholderia vietnamiensis]MCA8270712.1 TcpQ domain-containing protein [Burkholderia vietnamiensis]
MRAKVAFLVSAAFAPAAHAGFYTTDVPVPVAPKTTYQQSANESAATYKVPFAARGSHLSWAAKRALGAILTSVQDATKITISACGDPRGSDAIAYRRGAAIKGWLIENGISPDVVSVTTDVDASVARAGKLYNCVVTASHQLTPYQQLFGTAVGAPVADATLPVAAPVAPAVSEPIAPRAESSTSDTQLTMIRKILDLVARKVVKPEDAVAMMQEIAKTTDSDSSVSTPAVAPASTQRTYAPPLRGSARPRMQYVSARLEPDVSAPAVAPSLPTVAPAIAVEPVNQTWGFGENQTLKDTITAWAHEAGWTVRDWQVSGSYRVSGAPISGTFLDALRTICAAAPMIDIRADARSRQLIVTEARK